MPLRIPPFTRRLSSTAAKPGSLAFLKLARAPHAAHIDAGREQRGFDLDVSFEQLRALWDEYYLPRRGMESLTVANRFDEFTEIEEHVAACSAQGSSAQWQARINALFDKLARNVPTGAYRRTLVVEERTDALVLHAGRVQPRPVALKGGASVHVRPLEPADLAGVLDLVTQGCSAAAFRHRFLHVEDSPVERERLALHLMAQSQGHACASSWSIRKASSSAWPTPSLAATGTSASSTSCSATRLRTTWAWAPLLAHLIDNARAAGFRGIVANISPDNAVMLRVMGKFTKEAGAASTFGAGHLQFAIALDTPAQPCQGAPATEGAR